MKRIDRLVSDLCEEIDVSDQDAAYWKAEYDELKAKYNSLLDASIAASRRAGLGMVAIATDNPILAKAISGNTK